MDRAAGCPIALGVHRFTRTGHFSAGAQRVGQREELVIAHVPNWKRLQRSSATSNCARRTCGGGGNEIVAGDVSCRLIVVHVCIRVRQRSPTDNQHIHAQADPGHEPIKKDWPDAIRTSSGSNPETPAAHNPASCFIVSAFHIATSFETSPFARVSIALPGARATPSRRFATPTPRADHPGWRGGAVANSKSHAYRRATTIGRALPHRRRHLANAHCWTNVVACTAWKRRAREFVKDFMVSPCPYLEAVETVVISLLWDFAWSRKQLDFTESAEVRRTLANAK